MDKFQEEQRKIFQSLANDRRLKISAKRQIKTFVELLETEPGIGFDTTSALLYGFLRNEEFTEPGVCPLSCSQKDKALEISRYEATRDVAHETAFLTKASRLPLATLFGPDLDLKDLAVSFLTYALDQPLPHFSYEENKLLYEYLDIPRSDYYLNVFNLRKDLEKLGMSFDDFIVNLSRLRTTLWVPEPRFITVESNRIIDVVSQNLPESLSQLNGQDLENLMMELFDRAGYQVVKVGRRTSEGDGGIDVIAFTKDPIAGDLRVAVQCKATKNRIQPRVIREFNTSLENFNAHKGVFVTTSDFTSGVIDEVRTSGYPIELMDYAKLTNRIRGAVVKS